MYQKTRMLAYSALMCAIIIVSTLWFKFSIPGTDMLVTTQVFFVLLCGQLLPVKYCLYTIGAYLFIGLVGVPVFSATAGPAVIVTPSFGYLLGFPIATATVSALRCRLADKKGGRYYSAVVGVVVMYAVAMTYIAVLKAVYLDTTLTLMQLFSAYCFVFFPLDIAKALLSALLGKRLEKPLRLQEQSARA